MGKQIIVRTILTAMLTVAFSLASVGQTTDNAGNGASPTFGSIATPRPINPATDTTNPSARATQTLNPYLGSTPEGKAGDGEIRISLEDAIARGLCFNLGLIDSQQADAGVRAEREHALSQLLPQISARAQQSYEQLSFKVLNIKVLSQVVEPVARNAAGSMLTETYLTPASSCTGMPRALATPSP
jgi:hypothetical protein